jgi:micrococcal nuclease
MLRLLTVLAVLAVMGAAAAMVGCSWLSPDPAQRDVGATAGSVPGGVSGVVVDVVDGDTIDVGGLGRVRVIGIDTPERGECGFETASKRLAALVLGERVVLVQAAGDDVDRYGRLLRYVDVDGVDAGLALIEEGWAIARYDSRDGYGAHPREAGYIEAQAQAEAHLAVPGEALLAARDRAAGYECASP